MQDSAGEQNSFHKSPFSNEVSSDMFDKIKYARSTIDSAMSIFDRVDEKPIVAELAGEFLMKEDTPNEVKMEAFKKIYDLIENPAEYKENIEIAKTLIDMIRAQKDKGMRLRLASIFSHEAQIKHADFKNNDFDFTKYSQFEAKRLALDLLSSDKNADKQYQKWAKTLLSPRPGGIVDMYNSLYSRDMNLAITPEIIEEISQETNDLEGGTNNDNQDLRFTGNTVKLKSNYLPSLGKLERFRKETGKDLPIYLVRKVGGDLFAVEIPRSLTEKVGNLAERVRTGEISRKQAFDMAADLGVELLDILNDEQKARFLDQNVNIEMRFSTERSESVSNSSNQDLKIAA